MKFNEFGKGNTGLIRTEKATEYEEQGIKGPINLYSLYVRIWIGKTVVIVDLKEGYKRQKKKRREFKAVSGIVSG